MPLLPGKANIGRNIKELEQPSAHAPKGRPYEQALAIALKTAGVPKRASGGHVGALRGSTGGRADEVGTTVPNGSYIVPADVCSALGDGNTEAGFAKLEKLFPAKRAMGGGISQISGMKGMNPVLGSKFPKIIRPPAMPSAGMPKLPHLKEGGAVPVKLSHGEFSIPPFHVERVGSGDRERGNRALDHWVLSIRKHDIERRKHLPPPVQ